MKQLLLQKQQKPVIINKRYLLTTVMYQGSSCTVFDSIDMQNTAQCVVKIVLIQNVNNEEKIVKQLQGRIGIIGLFESGTFQQYHYQVLEKVGPSLKVWFQVLNKTFSYQTIANVAIKALSILEVIHEANYIHTNLRPSNILTSIINDSQILICDFQNTLKYSYKQDICRTLSYRGSSVNKYSSIGKHLNSYAFPKDDVESLLYVISYFLTQGQIFANSKLIKVKRDKYYYYMNIKQSFIPERDLKYHPECFIEFANRVKQLNPNEIPINYEYLKSPLKRFVHQNQAEYTFDWGLIKNYIKSAQNSPRQTLNSLDEQDIFQQPAKNKKNARQPNQLETIMEKSTEMKQSSVYTKHPLMMAKKSKGDYFEVPLQTEESQCDIEEDEPTDRSMLPEFYQKNF